MVDFIYVEKGDYRTTPNKENNILKNNTPFGVYRIYFLNMMYTPGFDINSSQNKKEAAYN